MSKNRKKQKIEVGGLFMGALYGVMGGICGIIITSAAPSFGSYFLMLLGFICLLVFELMIHEAGHLIFGLMTGYRLCSYRVFSFLWRKENGRVVCKRLSLAGTAGQCLMDPPETKEGAFPYILYNLGGVLMNLLTVPVFLILRVLAVPGSLLADISLIGVTIAVTFAVTNGIPLRLGTVNNDGSNLLTMIRIPSARRAFWLQLRIAARNAEGVRLRDMPEEWFPDPASAPMENSLEASLPVFTCNRLLDQGRISDAQTAIQTLLDRESAMVGLHRCLLSCDLATCRLLLGEPAGELLTSREQRRFMKSMKNYPSVLRTGYVSALLGENDRQKAQELQLRFEAAAASYPYVAEITSEQELMALAETRYKETHE